MNMQSSIYTVIFSLLSGVSAASLSDENSEQATTLAVKAEQTVSQEASTNDPSVPTLGTPVLIKPVEYVATAKAIYGSGVVRPVSEQTLAFKVPGYVEKVRVKAGQSVKRGQVLASLTLEEMDAQVSKAQSVLADAQRQRDRINSLRKDSLASDEQVRQAETQVSVAQADLRLANFNRRHAQIKAPADGRILQRSLEVNEYINPGVAAFVFADDKKGWMLKLNVTDRDRMRLSLNDSAEIRLDAYPSQRFEGRVREMAGRADVRTQTFEVQLQILTDKPLYSGLIAHAVITPSQNEALVKIPLESLISASGMDAKVYVVKDQKPVLKNIQLAYLQGDYGFVRSGLDKGDLLVVKGGSFINPGDALAIKQIEQTQSFLVKE
ncbi:efflux RND transporter periplasmic adaptor subunit [Bermanella marisrubri]|uniref:Membrane-fusion protein n=1 Tax=Bermanella marisrubri TaxID=207949 RepID=Q1MYE1_9GAMM|nr:efflux RND transporter periplasmic adaptor subunit [Bermanella marisrubri]EAT11004.1 Membrane-fusion protein [Oceanobacter sp. RED65] [Bermanella marisrubri]QIZ83751.1 efflux RND transporter periplasmic adaptor subunit [Bermanella marisrubri]